MQTFVRITRTCTFRFPSFTPYPTVLVAALCLFHGCSAWTSDTSALILASRDGNVQEIKRLIEEGTLVNSKNAHGATSLLTALRASQKEAYHLLLRYNADPNACDNLGECVMHLAATMEETWWLEEALSQRGNPNTINVGHPYVGGRTPLFYAVDPNRVDSVKLLLDAGADPKVRDLEGVTALECAAGRGRYQICLLLLEAGADPLNRPTEESQTFVDWVNERNDRMLPDEREAIWFNRVRTWLATNGYIGGGGDNTEVVDRPGKN